MKFIFIHTKSDFNDSEMINIFDENQNIHREFCIKLPSLFLIRPDKYIGFRGELQHADQLILHLQKIFV